MSVEEITEAAISRGLISPQAKTPATAMRARLYARIRTGSPALIRREHQPGKTRAVRDSVRRVYAG